MITLGLGGIKTQKPYRPGASTQYPSTRVLARLCSPPEDRFDSSSSVFYSLFRTIGSRPRSLQRHQRAVRPRPLSDFEVLRRWQEILRQGAQGGLIRKQGKEKLHPRPRLVSLDIRVWALRWRGLPECDNVWQFQQEK